MWDKKSTLRGGLEQHLGSSGAAKTTFEICPGEDFVGEKFPLGLATTMGLEKHRRGFVGDESPVGTTSPEHWRGFFGDKSSVGGLEATSRVRFFGDKSPVGGLATTSRVGIGERLGWN